MLKATRFFFGSVCVHIHRKVHLDKLHRENKHIETFEKLSSLLRVEPFNLRLLRKRVIVSKHLRYWDACQKDCEVILKWHVMKKTGKIGPTGM